MSSQLMDKPLPEFLKGVTFKCFTPKHVKKINKTIKKSLLQKEDPSQAAAYSAKIGKFYVIPCLPLMNLIRPWLYRCQQINALHFQYDAYWYFHLDSLNYNVYGIKGEYGWHVDANISGTPSAQKLTCLLNLSEEAYEGGEFISMSQPEKLKFDSGDGLVVNSLIAHRVTPITEGERITLTYWATGPLWR